MRACFLTALVNYQKYISQKKNNNNFTTLIFNQHNRMTYQKQTLTS